MEENRTEVVETKKEAKKGGKAKKVIKDILLVLAGAAGTIGVAMLISGKDSNNE